MCICVTITLSAVIAPPRAPGRKSARLIDELLNLSKFSGQVQGSITRGDDTPAEDGARVEWRGRRRTWAGGRGRARDAESPSSATRLTRAVVSTRPKTRNPPHKLIIKLPRRVSYESGESPGRVRMTATVTQAGARAPGSNGRCILFASVRLERILFFDFSFSCRLVRSKVRNWNITNHGL